MYDVILIGAGAAGIFAAYELSIDNPDMNILMIEKGYALDRRHCPKTENPSIPCKCKSCSIMEGFYGAGGYSDGKYNITNNFGGELYRYVGEKEAIDLMWYVDEINLKMGGEEAKLYSTTNSDLKAKALKHDLHLLDAQVRHLGTDRNLVIAGNMYAFIKDHMTILFETEAETVEKIGDTFVVKTKDQTFEAEKLILATGRTGSNWINKICDQFDIKTESNRVDIGVRVELPALVFKDITDEVYESKIVYRTDRYNDMVRTFCMNPYGEVVTESYGDIVTVNGHSYSDPAKHTENTNFALLVTNRFTEPFKNSNEYGESIARLSNMLGGGVIMQRFGDLVKGRRSSERRMMKCFTTPTLHATPGDLSLVLPKRQLDDIIEMIYALDKIAPGTANEDTLLYGVEVKFYNSMVEVDNNLETKVKGMYILGDCSGVTHSLSQAAASGIYVAKQLKEAFNTI
jgi:uncharacterized FAD-dependent dehydrogenase